MLRVWNEGVVRPAEVDDGVTALAAADCQHQEQHHYDHYQAAEQ